MLILFALLVVGLFGMLGVVVDGGRLRVTRQQLDAGAECAALEGLRFKDVEGDAARRDRAAQSLAWLFDDDLDAANGDRMGLGAGTLPIVTGAAPVGGAVVLDTGPAARAWKPGDALERNLPNAAHGDLVAGVHVPGGPAT
ncbi:MAG: pilus assembly protein TadG-related protein, partial [Planctomycetota bacterium]